MIGILGIILVTMVLSMKVHWKGIDGQYLSKPYTQPIKGIFIIIVFLSHIRTYTEYTSRGDVITINLLNYFGQLMVALFLFYSGYGIYEAIKSKGNSYIESLMKNRFGKTFFDFALAIILFVVVNACLGKFYPIKQIILSFIGWSSVGNSAWYMFAIFTLYILSFVCFMMFRNVKYGRFISLCLMSACSLGYVYIMSLIKDNYWSSTYLCFVAGMWYSFFKVYVDKVLQKYPVLYYCATIFVIVAYNYMFTMRYKRLMIFNLVAILFCLVFVFLAMKISFRSKFLTWMGDHLFWVYILQRVPMLVLQHFGFADSHPYVYLYVCFAFTIGLAYFVNIVANQLKKKIWG